MDKYELKKQTKTFAHNCVKVAISFPKNKLGSYIEGQLIRCSSSVAANYRAAILARSTASFAAKLSIIIEEVDESDFWLEFALEAKNYYHGNCYSSAKRSKRINYNFYCIQKNNSNKKQIINQQ